MSDIKTPLPPEEVCPAPEGIADAMTDAAGESARREKKRARRRARRQEVRLVASAAPHIARRDGSAALMVDVIVALLPVLLFSGIYFFGPRVFVVAGVSVVSCEVFEILTRLILRRRQAVGDLSAVVTGLLLALCLPVTVPYWMVVLGAFFAIVVVKQLYGGLGMNFMNPALAARVFLFSFPLLMNTWVESRFFPSLDTFPDAVTAPTVMASLHAGQLPAEELIELFTGIRGGSIGEVSAALILLGGLYLALRGTIRLRIPLFYLGTVALLNWLFPPAGVEQGVWVLYQLMGGGLMLGAFFMATDPVTSPVTPGGQRLYGVGCGLLTVFFRAYGAYPEGVAFAILLMNAASWLLDRLRWPGRYGAGVLDHTEGGADHE